LRSLYIGQSTLDRAESLVDRFRIRGRENELAVSLHIARSLLGKPMADPTSPEAARLRASDILPAHCQSFNTRANARTLVGNSAIAP
jgi:hypothetical protein